MVRAPVSHTGGHWFESSIAHHTREQISYVSVANSCSRCERESARSVASAGASTEWCRAEARRSTQVCPTGRACCLHPPAAVRIVSLGGTSA